MGSPRKALCHFYPKRYDVPVFILGSAILLGVGLSLPLFKVTQMVFWKSSYSIITSVVDLWKQREYFLASVIFVFSVVFPTVKLLTLFLLWSLKLSDERRSLLLKGLALLGKWSMLDVMILAVTIVVVKLRAFAQVEPRTGVYLFSAAIFLSMIATMHVERLARKISKP